MVWIFNFRHKLPETTLIIVFSMKDGAAESGGYWLTRCLPSQREKSVLFFSRSRIQRFGHFVEREFSKP